MSLPERDPRIYFAAERTFLAWIRTGLALMGFGFVVARFGWFLRELGLAAANPAAPASGFSLWVGTGLVAAGVVVNVTATVQHLRIVRHLNEGREVTGKPSASGVALALLLAATGMAMAVYLLSVR
jgi:putative membrane protein